MNWSGRGLRNCAIATDLLIFIDLGTSQYLPAIIRVAILTLIFVLPLGGPIDVVSGELYFFWGTFSAKCEGHASISAQNNLIMHQSTTANSGPRYKWSANRTIQRRAFDSCSEARKPYARTVVCGHHTQQGHWLYQVTSWEGEPESWSGGKFSFATEGNGSVYGSILLMACRYHCTYI